MEDIDDSEGESYDVPSRASGDESCGSSTRSKSDDDSESSGTHEAGGQTVSDNEYGGGQTMSDEDPGGQAPADQLVKKQEHETDGGTAQRQDGFRDTG